MISKKRIAFVVSHPVQYYAPLHRRLAARGDLEVKVFFTWHDGADAVADRGFGRKFAWDVPLTEGYDRELVPNTARDPGTHHFRGLRNPELAARVNAWQPDAIHLTGYAWASHLSALRTWAACGTPVLFRGDSHLLDGQRGFKAWLKSVMLKRIFRWPRAFLCVGQANRRYYEAFDVPPDRLFQCPHSIEVERFAEPQAEHEEAARAWRAELGVKAGERVLLFAGKFEPKKRPVELMEAFLREAPAGWVLVMLGDGVLGGQVRQIAERQPARCRVLPFQNQSRMPVAYRLGDVFVLPSAYAETWGLAVNEALACGRPVLVSDRVGCAEDVVEPGWNGLVFRHDDWRDFGAGVRSLETMLDRLEPSAIVRAARRFDVTETESTLMTVLRAVLNS